MKKPKNTIKSVRKENKKPLRNGKEHLYVTKVIPKDGSTPYYTTHYFFEWITIGGNYGIKNEIWVIEKF